MESDEEGEDKDLDNRKDKKERKGQKKKKGVAWRREGQKAAQEVIDGKGC